MTTTPRFATAETARSTAPDPALCAACSRHFTGSETGRHAARHWILTRSGALVCRTCLDRARRGALDLAPILDPAPCRSDDLRAEGVER